MGRYKIRKNVFETNSSSVHTLVIEHDENLKLSDDLDFKDGVLTIPCGDFNGKKTVSGQKGKLMYIATIIALYNWFETERGKDMSSKDEEHPWLLDDLFCAMSRQFPEIKEIRITETGNANMDRQYVDYDTMIVNLTDERNVIDFVFSDKISVDIWHD